MKKIYMSIVSLSIMASFPSIAASEKMTGWCESFNDGHWSKQEDVKTKEDCNTLDMRSSENGRAYAWQNRKRIDSQEGQCTINKTEDSLGTNYQTSQIGCENHDKNGLDSYHWISDLPTLYTKEDHRGFTHVLTEDIPSLCQEGEMNRLCGLIKSYIVPKGWTLSFYEKENYKGTVHIRSGYQKTDEISFIEGKKINSIKISKNTAVIGNETVTASSQIYFGEGKPTESCGEQGRLLTPQDVDNIGHTTLCNDVAAPYAIWKMQGSDGNEWSFMGKGYNCEIKAGVNPDAPSLCVMKVTTPEMKAFTFAAKTFRGNKAWEGKAEVKTNGDNVPDTRIHSFTLGSALKLTAFSEANYTGTQKEYRVSTAEADFEIRSYKITHVNDVL